MHRALVVVLAVVSACGKSESAPGTGSGSGAPPASAVAVFVDDTQVATIDATLLATWPRLDALVPAAAQRLGMWESIGVRGATAEDIPSPADKYPSLIPVVYPAAGGAAFGMFDLVDHARKGAPRMSVAGVREVRIKLAEDSDRGMNEEGSKAAFDPAKLQIAIEGGTKPALTGTEIIELPREAPPNGDTATQGWSLLTLLKAAGITNPRAILLTDSAGTTLTLTAAQLDPATSVPYVKLNRQGQLRFRVYVKQGDGWTLGGNLRGLASIKVTEK